MSAHHRSKLQQGHRRAWAGLAVAALVIAGCGSDDAADDSADDGDVVDEVAEPTETPADDDGAGEGAVTATIAGFAFDPASIEVADGSTITWTNTDGASHTVTGTGDLVFDSGNLGEGESFTLTVDQVGEFAYVCSIHGSMQGTIAVS
jgi:plastocyanin